MSELAAIGLLRQECYCGGAGCGYCAAADEVERLERDLADSRREVIDALNQAHGYEPEIDGNTAWLIECGSPADYYCSGNQWCSNPYHARRFLDESVAKNKAATMKTMEPVRVAEHLFENPEEVKQ